MLVDATSDQEFQAYLDRAEQRLHVEMASILMAGTRLTVSKSPDAGQAYVEKRGGRLLLRSYRKVYADQFTAVSGPERKAISAAASEFLQQQLAYLTQRAGRQIRRISASLRDFITGLIAGMVAEGKSNRAITAAIQQQAPEIGRTRAATIARTETHTSALAAIDATIRHKAIEVRTKTWWSASDRRVRDSHREAHGQTVPYAQSFTVDGVAMKHPGDPAAPPELVINCRCACLFNT